MVGVPSRTLGRLAGGLPAELPDPPPTSLTPNSDMSEAGLVAAGAFVDELLALGAIRTAEDGMKILANAPLFVVEKPEQPGQWRVIADMKEGGQNECIGYDPVFLPRSNHILEEMYAGGYSAVVDMSKYFYNIPTHPDDHLFWPNAPHYPCSVRLLWTAHGVE